MFVSVKANDFIFKTTGALPLSRSLHLGGGSLPRVSRTLHLGVGSLPRVSRSLHLGEGSLPQVSRTLHLGEGRLPRVSRTPLLLNLILSYAAAKLG